MIKNTRCDHLSKMLRIAQALIFQDLFWGFRKTKVITNYTIVKLSEEIILCVLIVLVFKFHDLLRIAFIITFIHIINAILSPSFYTSTSIKNKIKPVKRIDAIKNIYNDVKQLCRYKIIKSIYITGSLSNPYKSYVRDVDLILVPCGFLSSYVLLWYIRFKLLCFMIRRIKYFPDFYVFEKPIRNYYAISCSDVDNVKAWH